MSNHDEFKSNINQITCFQSNLLVVKSNQIKSPHWIQS